MQYKVDDQIEHAIKDVNRAREVARPRKTGDYRCSSSSKAGEFGTGAEVRWDTFNALQILGEPHWHEPKSTPPKKVGEWLPKVHIVISNFKSFLAGTLVAGLIVVGLRCSYADSGFQ